MRADYIGWARNLPSDANAMVPLYSACSHAQVDRMMLGWGFAHILKSRHSLMRFTD